MGLLATTAERLFGWIHRFLTEVIASVVTTACVAGATTLYLSFGSGEAPAPLPASSQAAMFAPAPDKGAPAFVRAAMAAERASPPALQAAQAMMPPKRPRIVDAEARSASETLTAPPVVTEAASVFEMLPQAPALDSGSTYEPDAIESRPLPPLPYAQAASDPERTLLGMPVPEVVPTGADIADGVRGIGHAVAGLVR